MLSSHFIWPHARLYLWPLYTVQWYMPCTSTTSRHWIKSIFVILYFLFYICRIHPTSGSCHIHVAWISSLHLLVSCQYKLYFCHKRTETFSKANPVRTKHDTFIFYIRYRKAIQWHRSRCNIALPLCLYHTLQHFTQFFAYVHFSLSQRSCSETPSPSVKMIYINMLAQLDMNGI